MAIRLESVHPRPGDDVTIVWKGRRIAKVIFPSGKVVQFDETAESGEAPETEVNQETSK